MMEIFQTRFVMSFGNILPRDLPSIRIIRLFMDTVKSIPREYSNNQQHHILLVTWHNNGEYSLDHLGAHG